MVGQNIFMVEFRSANSEGRETDTVAFLHPDFDACVAFIRSQSDADKKPDEDRWWWWAISVNEIGAPWCFPENPVVPDLWFYSWDGRELNYQPVNGYLAPEDEP